MWIHCVESCRANRSSNRRESEMIRYRNALLAGISFVAIFFGVARGLFAQSPASTSASAVKATTDSTAESTDKQGLQPVERIREDVRGLRHEVDNLRTLLESQRAQSGSSRSPERIH